MNERIQKLINQATITNTVQCEGYMGKSYTRQEDYFDKEKFAELIIMECAGVTLDYKNDVYYTGWCDHAEEILRHFGVEE